MKIFVTGGAGFVGTAIVRALKAAGHAPIGLAIDTPDMAKVEQAGGVAVQGDLSTPAGLEVLRRYATESDGVITAVKVCRRTDLGKVDPNPENREQAEGLANKQWEEVNLASIQTIVAALRGTGKPFIYNNSSVSIGDMGTAIADEETVPPSPGYYGHWQTLHEKMVLAAAAENIRTVSLRAGMIFGPHPNGLPLGRPHPANMHQQLWEEGAVGYYNDGSDISTGVHVDDFAELFVRALEKAPPGSIFYGGAADYTRKELAVALSYAYGYGGKTRSWTLEEAKRVLGDGKMFKFLTENHRTTSAKAIRMLGWQPKAPSLLEFAYQEAARLYGTPRPTTPPG